MESVRYLLVQQNGTMRIVSKLESSKGGEVPIRLRVQVPDSYWQVPTVAATVILPEKDPDIGEVIASIDLETTSDDTIYEENLEDM